MSCKKKRDIFGLCAVYLVPCFLLKRHKAILLELAHMSALRMSEKGKDTVHKASLFFDATPTGSEQRDEPFFVCAAVGFQSPPLLLKNSARPPLPTQYASTVYLWIYICTHVHKHTDVHPYTYINNMYIYLHIHMHV